MRSIKYWLIIVLVLGGGYFYYQSQIAKETVSVPVEQIGDGQSQPAEPSRPYHNTAFVNEGKTLFHEGSPTPELGKILDREGIESRTPRSILEETQRKWLGMRSDSVRQAINVQTTPPSSEDLQLYREVGMVDAIHPTQKHYNYALILGTVTRFMASSLDYLINLWEKEGIRFDKIIFLTGDRPLYGEYVKFDQMPKEVLRPEEPQPVLKTETQAARFLADRMAVRFPPGFPQGENLIVVEAKAPQGKRRANTKDTIIAFLDAHFKPGTYLAIAQQPFAGRQALVLKKDLSKAGFNGELVATPALDTMPKSFYLDSLTRWIYELVSE